MRSLYIPILCFVFLRFGAQSLPGDSEELRDSIDIENIFPELSDYVDDDVQEAAFATTGPCVDEGKYSCKDCLSPAYVNDICEEEVVLNCTVGTACFVSPDASYAYCATESATECSCGSAPKQCDFYDNNNLLLCSTNGPFLSQPCPPNEKCSGGECVDSSQNISTTTTLAPAPGNFSCTPGYTGIVLEAPACQNAIYCQNGVQIASSECKSGEYFDPLLGCQPAPPAKCGDNCAGLCQDKVDCEKFYICDGNGNALQHEDCPTGTYFNPNLSPPKCESDSTICPATAICTAYTESPDATTQAITPPVSVSTDSSNPVSPTGPVTADPSNPVSPTGPVTADPSNPVNPTGPVTQSSNSVGTSTDSNGSSNSPGDTTIYYPTDVACNADTVGTYEYPPDCTKYYWCQESSPGKFEVVVRQCWGGLAYNPEIGGCDYPENVPGCNVKTR